MAYGNESGGVDLSMPVAPVNYGSNNGGNNGFGDNGWWVLLLLLFAMGGWGNNNGGFSGGSGGGGGNQLYPWMNQADITTSGFQNQMLNTQLMGIQNSVTSGFGDVQNSLCSGFAGVNANISNGFAQAEIGDNARQMANMQQIFSLQSALQQCCCDNRAATADLKYTVAQENCADRYEAAQNTRDIIDSQTRGTQAILDKLCQLELDGVRGQLAQAQRENTGLQNQINMANLAASQIAQTADIINGTYTRLSQCPVNSTPVYGNQPIFSCNNNGCGCGCGGNGLIA